MNFHDLGQLARKGSPLDLVATLSGIEPELPP